MAPTVMFPPEFSRISFHRKKREVAALLEGFIPHYPPCQEESEAHIISV